MGDKIQNLRVAERYRKVDEECDPCMHRDISGHVCLWILVSFTATELVLHIRLSSLLELLLSPWSPGHEQAYFAVFTP